MMFIGHNSERYGYLCQNGVAIPSESIARRCGCTPEQYAALLAELDGAGVPSRTTEGIIFSRRMVRDDKKRKETNVRVQKHRSNADVTQVKLDCNTASSSSVSSSEPKGSSDEADAKALPPMALAQKVAAELCLSGPGIMQSIAGAIGFLVKHESKTPHTAVEFLIAKAQEEIKAGAAPTKFWFDDRKWRKADGKNGLGRGYVPLPGERSK